MLSSYSLRKAFQVLKLADVALRFDVPVYDFSILVGQKAAIFSNSSRLVSSSGTMLSMVTTYTVADKV